MDKKAQALSKLWRVQAGCMAYISINGLKTTPRWPWGLFGGIHSCMQHATVPAFQLCFVLEQCIDSVMLLLHNFSNTGELCTLMLE